jgi:membrane-bound serine protease (ClpP class)
MTILFSLLIAGYILILAEFVVPGGILGVLGACCLVAAGVMGFFHFETSTALTIVAAELVSGVILTIVWFRYFFDSALGKGLVHKNALSSLTTSTPKHSELMDATGVTLTPLRPSGTARILEKRYDVLAEGKMVESGQEVKVVKIENDHIIVREIQT